MTKKYYCTCRPKGHVSSENTYEHNNFRQVEVDEDEICVDCRYYAITLDGDKPHKIYEYLTEEGKGQSVEEDNSLLISDDGIEGHVLYT